MQVLALVRGPTEESGSNPEVRVRTLHDHERMLGALGQVGDDHAGTVSELNPGGDVPADLSDLMCDSVICEDTSKVVKKNNPKRLRLEPWGVADAAHP